MNSESCEWYNEQYADVELTDLERAKVLYDARSAKFWRLDAEKQEARKQAILKEIDSVWDWQQLRDFVLTAGAERIGYSNCGGKDGKPVYLVDENNTQVIEMLCKYFSADPDFENMGENYSLMKGLLVMGNVGRGKTDLLRIFMGNKRQSFTMVPCRQAAAYYASMGQEAIEIYSNYRHMVAGDIRVFNQRKLGWFFDDLGTESDGKNYGNSLNVMAEIIQYRYERKGVMPFYCTHITTNLSADEIEKNYGQRVRSRLREMFNTIILGGNDRRK